MGNNQSWNGFSHQMCRVFSSTDAFKSKVREKRQEDYFYKEYIAYIVK